ncbi:tRNA (adenosine(37)-N6)-threonylcarbamoyltransferase complex dimerization subunit type 1 TsaB [Fuchsiella alkaliacetigena]|uniref:tRNA (adenosine(37)-N6)-threonylcarbamoyltransferase complex dimerization subunit type 1 TsaB n=1 Tax=Fuchsiella alkaliacetigena TaxID=957042 RepID=UPI00200A03A0|nr:tRNA (adenosine(37)-N6)-threonylcarbamoyltransferase complex dimerization subunit type 1 TsaB [Fuchsiella alkaliacetigena]MCK8824131.1 tRNA (adenosine(37)-N6)-threonylcarbamoyltransferase complex dimerization subunit type 1 TsaB [Fuchsiella alkaliacetigena]
MLILALDSATSVGAVALYQGEKLIAESNLNLELTHSQRLFPQIIELLKAARVEGQDLEGIVTGIGPGSFTGIRIGMATAKTLAQSWNLEMVGVSTLELLANALLETERAICPLIDAKRERVYTALYQGQQQEGLKKLRLPEQILAVVKLLERLKQELSGEVLFVGPAVEKYRELIKKELGKQALFVPKLYHLPRGGVLARVGALKLAAGQGSDFVGVKPNYLKLSQAERDWVGD